MQVRNRARRAAALIITRKVGNAQQRGLHIVAEVEILKISLRKSGMQ